MTMIKNDGDIVEAFVRHHAMLFDHLVVLDHSSTDNTPAILRALQHEGLPLTVMRDESLSFQQGCAPPSWRGRRSPVSAPISCSRLMPMSCSR